jgi:electron transfer flavoprotein alpha subunit
VGCTRPAFDQGWVKNEHGMIGTSGKTVRPKVYIGFGISGATHHVCGIKDAGVIISVNRDQDADVFLASDYKAVADGTAVIEEMVRILENEGMI